MGAGDSLWSRARRTPASGFVDETGGPRFRRRVIAGAGADGGMSRTVDGYADLPEASVGGRGGGVGDDVLIANLVGHFEGELVDFGLLLRIESQAAGGRGE